jgi:hypothetical protein
MSLGALILSLPVALGGESAGHESTGLAVISLVSIVLGYLLIAGLWYFVFREKARDRRKRGPSD